MNENLYQDIKKELGEVYGLVTKIGKLYDEQQQRLTTIYEWAIRMTEQVSEILRDSIILQEEVECIKTYRDLKKDMDKTFSEAILETQKLAICQDEEIAKLKAKLKVNE